MDQKEEFKGEDVGAKTVSEDIVNIALLGVDNDAGTDIKRSDVMKIISLNFDDKSIKITSLQRDNLVYIPMQNKYDKLNHAYRDDDVQGSLSAINYNLDLDVTKYVKFTFESVVNIVDILGGVDINLTNAEAGSLGLSGAGMYTLNGNQALSYSIIRNIDSDYGRMQRQNNVINALTTSMQGKSPFELLDIVNSVMPYLETNISNGTIKDYMMKLVSFNLGNVAQYQFPSNGYDSIQSSISLYGYGPLYILKDYSGEVTQLHTNIYGTGYKPSDNVLKVERDAQAYIGR